jgi:putative tricarboxylic transport membrane protein
MVSQGSFMPVFTRPVALILFLIIVLTVVSQFGWYKKMLAGIKTRLFNSNR